MKDVDLKISFIENIEAICISSCSVVGLGLVAAGICDAIFQGKIAATSEFLNLPHVITTLIDRIDSRTPLEKVAVGCNVIFLRNYIEDVWSRQRLSRKPN